MYQALWCIPRTASFTHLARQNCSLRPSFGRLLRISQAGVLPPGRESHRARLTEQGPYCRLSRCADPHRPWYCCASGIRHEPHCMPTTDCLDDSMYSSSRRNLRRSIPVIPRHVPDKRPHAMAEVSHIVDWQVFTNAPYKKRSETTTRTPNDAVQLLFNQTHIIGPHATRNMKCTTAHTHYWDACVPHFRLATPAGYQAKHIPKQNLVISITRSTYQSRIQTRSYHALKR